MEQCLHISSPSKPLSRSLSLSSIPANVPVYLKDRSLLIGIKDAIIFRDFYTTLSLLSKLSTVKILKKLAVFDFYANKICDIAKSMLRESLSSHEEFVDDTKKSYSVTDILTCSICKFYFVSPTTVNCGHTFCRNCIIGKLHLKCPLCNDPIWYQFRKLSTNVIICNFQQKHCPSHEIITQLHEEGDQYMKLQQNVLALEKYSAALKYGPNHVIFCKRSSIYSAMSSISEALADARSAISLLYLWHEGHYCEGIAQFKSGDYISAAKSFFIALTLAPHSQFIRAKFISSLHKFSDAQFQYSLSLARTHQLPQERVTAQSPGCVQCLCTHTKLWKSSLCLTSSELRSFEQKRLYLVKNINSATTGIEAELCVNQSDFECSLCYRLFSEPTTTMCGHTFCRKCLNRCLDHNSICPLCKTSIQTFQAVRPRNSCSVIEYLMMQCMPAEYAERARISLEELRSFQDYSQEVPVFVCTLSMPGQPCHLHVFEPRYKLMIRRCMESGTKKFAMTISFNDEEDFVNVGTLLEVKELHTYTDGRSLLHCVSGSRFKVISRGERDGYYTAKLEIMLDCPVPADRVALVDQLQAEVYEIAFNWWLTKVPSVNKDKIEEYYGTLPPLSTTSENGPNWHWWLIQVLPLDRRVQLQLLSCVSLELRTKMLRRILVHIMQEHSLPGLL